MHRTGSGADGAVCAALCALAESAWCPCANAHADGLVRSTAGKAAADRAKGAHPASAARLVDAACLHIIAGIVAHPSTAANETARQASFRSPAR
jgi:hypothetical protein